MLKVKVTKETLTKAIEYHAVEGHGLTPILDSDEDLCDWARWVLADVMGYQTEELDAAGLLVTMNGDGAIIAVQAGKTGDDVLDAVRRHIE